MEIDLAVSDGIALVTLNAPDRRNAITPEMAQHLINVLDGVDADSNVGAIVLTGLGRGFCAGADLSTLAANGDDPLADANYAGMTTIYASFRRFGGMRADTVGATLGPWPQKSRAA